MIMYDKIKKNEEIKIYIENADKYLEEIGYTEHSFAHVCKVAEVSSNLLKDLKYDEHTQDLCAVASYMHDIGNCVNRYDHAISGAVMSFTFLDKLGFGAKDIVQIIQAIGNHDESSANCVSPISAALILADKTDVRRSRVRCKESEFDIHDRVNYSVTNSELVLQGERIVLFLTIDITVTPIMDYFEIFLGRMTLCKMAAKYLSLNFGLVINGQKLL